MPVAADVKVAVSPAVTVTLVGCAVIEGGDVGAGFTVRVKYWVAELAVFVAVMVKG